MSYPLGKPKNRQTEAPEHTPDPLGRPNWRVGSDGKPVYIEPPRPGIQDWTGRGFGGTVPPKKP